MLTKRNWMLGLTLVAGMLGAGAATAKAAPIQFQVGINEGYVPPCPGDGYVWVDGYYNGPYWVAGTWVFRGHGWGRRPVYGYGYGYREPVYREGYGYGGRYDRFDHGRDFRDGRGYERGFDRGRGFGGPGSGGHGFDHRR